MFLKKLLSVFGRQKVSENHGADVVKYARKRASPLESNTDDSHLATDYDEAAHAGILDRDQEFDVATHVKPASRAAIEASWGESTEDEDVVDVEKAGTDLVDEFSRLTDDEELEWKRPVAAKRRED